MKTYKAKGIVLSTVKYGDKSLIVQMLTSTFGRQSYIVQGLGSGKGRGSKMALYQPLFALEYEGVISDKSDLHRMRDVQSGIVLQSTPYDVRKSTIALFIAEVLYRLVGESQADQLLFDFVWGSVEALDTMEQGVANFHLWFMAHLSRFLGFSPGNEYVEGCWFDMREGLYTPIRPTHDKVINAHYTKLFNDLLDCDVLHLAEIGLNRTERSDILSALVEYYALHLDTIRRVQSLQIFQSLF